MIKNEYFNFNPVTFHIIACNKVKAQPKKESLEFLTDEEIMVAVKGGKTEKLAFIYEKHKKRFFNYFVKMTFDHEMSQDLLQNLFVRILKYKHTYRMSQPFLPWSYRIARNLVYDSSKKKNPAESGIEIEKISDQLSDFSEDRQVIDREEKLMLVMLKLPPERRELITWTKIEGMKYEDVARIRETTVGAIKVQVHRAMAQLKTLYFESNGE